MEISDRFHGFMLVRTVTSAPTGLLTGRICWLGGIELSFVWGYVALMLNFIPTIGSMIAVVPPSLMALVQFEKPFLS